MGRGRLLLKKSTNGNGCSFTCGFGSSIYNSLATARVAADPAGFFVLGSRKQENAGSFFVVSWGTRHGRGRSGEWRGRERDARLDGNPD